MQLKPEKMAEMMNKLSAHDFENMSDEELDKILGDHGEIMGNITDSFDPYKAEDNDSDDSELNEFDFDPSEGLSFLVHKGSIECYYEDVKDKEDQVSGAYIVSAAKAKIDFHIKDPSGTIVLQHKGKMEDEYDIPKTQVGVYELCFSNINYSDNMMVTHVTKMMKSKHPVEKSHVSRLSLLAQHLDLKLGEFESDQRLLQIRTDRHMKTEESTHDRVTYYSTMELFTYILISIFQVVYIKGLLNAPTSRGSRSWA